MSQEKDFGNTLRTLEDIESEAPDVVAEGEAEHDRRQRAKRRDLSTVFRTVADHGWHEGEPPEDTPLVTYGKTGNQWLPRGKVGMLVAPGGTGKSQAVIQLAMCIASDNPDRKWLNFFEIPDEARGYVVLALGEEGPKTFHRRVANVFEAWGADEHERQTVAQRLYALPMADKSTALMTSPIPVWRLDETVERLRAIELQYDPDGAPDSETLRTRLLEGRTEQYEQWRKLLAHPPGAEDGRQWKAIILDPASQFIGPDVETDNASATRFVQMLQSWAVKPWAGADVGPTVLVAHHANKRSQSQSPEEYLMSQGAARGSSALTDGVRWQANMVADRYEESLGGETTIGELVGLQVCKSNDGIKGDTVWLQRAQGGVLRWLHRDEAERLRSSSDEQGGDFSDKF